MPSSERHELAQRHVCGALMQNCMICLSSLQTLLEAAFVRNETLHMLAHTHVVLLQHCWPAVMPTLCALQTRRD